MNKNLFVTEIAEMILSAVKKPSAKGRESLIIKLGHFNGRVFNIEEFLKQRFGMIVRILVNLAMDMNRKDFMLLWNTIGNRICEIADNYGDEFNATHKRTAKLR